MDARVNDFLNEINEIAPLNENKPESVWEKCLDEDSGYYYYWNTKTNEVTWDMPAEYRAHSNKTKVKKSPNLYIPPRTAPLFPSTSGLLPPVSDAIKIYKIGECTDTIAGSTLSTSRKENVNHFKDETKKFSNVKPFRKKGDSRDEKIVLISSYGEGNESEDEKYSNENTKVNGSKPSSTANSEEDDDVDILTKIQRKATEMKKISTDLDEQSKNNSIKKTDTREISGFSLVAGYSDSEEESENENSKTVFPIAPPPEENRISHSTLFPVTKPIDIKDFEVNSKSEDFDSKAFQRKRRIGIALINTGKKIKTDDDNERKGLGFSSENSNGNEGSLGSMYPGFKSGGVMFVKTDVLNPSTTTSSNNNNNNNNNSNNEISEQNSKNVSKEIDDTYMTLKEKLGFLNEGREAASPVQVMLIQLETLYTASKSGNLKQNYLKNWLEETCSDLIKLEKDTTPEGWLLQWDRDFKMAASYRTHKRYYYQNATTGESQWEYPQADVTVCDEAMDICTTPPPNGAEPTIHMSPPPPPAIASPSPPPPPKISDFKPSKIQKNETKEGVSGTDNDSNSEPLPPGVDEFEAPAKTKESQDDMSDVLNSFYSDIAAIETSNSPPVPVSEDSKNELAGDAVQEQSKKKKKTKVKLAQGIAMKKKGVSKLVEKWKNVQMSYND